MNKYTVCMIQDILALCIKVNNEYKDLRYFHKDTGWLFASMRDVPNKDVSNIIGEFESDKDIDIILENIPAQYPEAFL